MIKMEIDYFKKEHDKVRKQINNVDDLLHHYYVNGLDRHSNQVDKARKKKHKLEGKSDLLHKIIMEFKNE